MWDVARSRLVDLLEKAMQAANHHSQQGQVPLYHQVAALSPTSQELPGTAYQFNRWYELDVRDGSDRTSDGGSLLTGSALLSPRVREGPANSTCPSLGFAKKGKDWKDYRNSSEDWEHTEAVNLSYQDLGDNYQLKNFHRCLNRLVMCKHLQLLDNSVANIRRVTLPCCIHLNLSRNCCSSFKNLPKAPNLEHLSLADNSVSSLRSLSTLASKYPCLKTLVLKGNPVADACDYRYRVFKTLPRLELLDGYPCLPSDRDLLSSPSSTSCSSCESDRCIVC